MRNTFAWILRAMTIVAMVLSSAAYLGSSTPQAQAPAQKAPIAIASIARNGIHYVAPREDVVLRKLTDLGMVRYDASKEEKDAALRTYFNRFQKSSDTWVDPKYQVWAEQREDALKNPNRSPEVSAIQPVTAKVFALAVDFGATETFEIPTLQGYDENDNPICITTTTTITGPLAGNMPHPGPLDNNTLWYSPTLYTGNNADFYGKLVFGHEGAGRVRFDLTDPEDGQPGIDLSGITVQDYYEHVAGFQPDGVTPNVFITGTITGWVTVPHSEGWYGADVCGSDNHGGGAGHDVPELIVDAINVFSDTNPTWYNDTSADAFWPQYDLNDDGIIDTFWIIHAGMGQEAGGGKEGDFAIWAHSSDMRYYRQWIDTGFKVYEGDPNTTDDDLYIGPYTMQPENLDMGVVAEEFGHNYFGLPDLYTTDAENSIGFWNIMASGAWGGPLGGTAPAGMPLWFRMIAICGVDAMDAPIPCNWQEPMVTRSYDDATMDYDVTQLETVPGYQTGALKGIRVNLPDQEQQIINNAGEGKGAWSGSGHDGTEVSLTRELAVPGTGAAILTIDSAWDIEEDWDYGYVMVNDVLLADMDGIFRTTNPNGNNLGVGLTGSDQGTLRFDLSAYKGQTVTLEILYKTDAAATQTGWWIDNIALDGTVIEDFEGATEPGTFPNWTNSPGLGWEVVPTVKVNEHYYLVEVRSTTKYDKQVRTAYITTLSEPTEDGAEQWRVDRVPYNIPAALVYYRNEKYPEGYSQRGYYTDEPSFGPKNKLLLVDMNPIPLRGVGRTVFNSRASSYDAGLTLQDTEAFSISQYLAATGPIVGPFNYPSKPAVTNFNDAKGYYPGFYMGDPCPEGYVCPTNYDGSAVLPAKGLYSIRLTDFEGNAIPEMYGAYYPPSWFGSGDPGDDAVQYGVNIDLLSMVDPNNATQKTDDYGNTLATIRVSNRAVYVKATSETSTDVTGFNGPFTVTYQYTITNAGKEPANNVFIKFDLDPRLTPVSFKVDGEVQGRINTDTLTWDATEALRPGESVTVTVVASGELGLMVEPGEWLRTYVRAFDGTSNRELFYDTPFSSIQYRLYLPDMPFVQP